MRLEYLENENRQQAATIRQQSFDNQQQSAEIEQLGKIIIRMAARNQRLEARLRRLEARIWISPRGRGRQRVGNVVAQRGDGEASVDPVQDGAASGSC